MCFKITFLMKRDKWKKSECQIEASKYIYKKDFYKYSYGAYQAASRNKWLEELCSHMIPLGNEYKRLVYRAVFPDHTCYVGLTSNFNRRISEHLTKKGAIYAYIIKTNLTPFFEKLTDYIDVNDAKNQEEYWKCKFENDGYICLNTAKTGGLGSTTLLQWTKEKCKIEALKYKTRNEFLINNHSAYNSSHRNKWFDEICSHMIIIRKKWTKEECEDEAIKYKNRGEFAKKNHKVWSFAKKYNWLDDICLHMKNLKNIYTKDECKKEALKYKTRSEFKLNNHKIWQFSYKHDWLNDICSHMIPLRNSWSKDECEKEFLKYKNITEFSRKSHNIYEFARKRKWLNYLKTIN